MSSLAAARAAREELLQRIGDRVDINGVGISNDQLEYFIKVNVATERAKAAIPDHVGNVRVIKEVVGGVEAEAEDAERDVSFRAAASYQPPRLLDNRW